MDYGWVSIHRQIQNHWLWEDKPFSRGQAWVDLIILANHEDVKMAYKGEIITCKRGDVNRSILQLSNRWGWSRHKTRDFLKLLENDGMVTVNATKHRTTISLVKYENFAYKPTTKGQQKDNKRTTKGQQKDINNNVNNDNNINNILYADNPTLNETIIAFVEHRKSMKKPMTDRAIKLMITNLNKLSPDVNIQIEILNQSIINGWQGIFPLKNQNNQKKGSGRKEVVPDWMDKQKKKNNFNNYPQREYDMDQLEKDLIEKSRRETGNKPDLSERIAALKEKLGQQ